VHLLVGEVLVDWARLLAGEVVSGARLLLPLLLQDAGGSGQTAVG
jgi:hypothetical protein